MDRTKLMTMARILALLWAGFWGSFAFGLYIVGSGKTIYGILSIALLIGICTASWKNPRNGSLIFLVVALIFLVFGIGLMLTYPDGAVHFTILSVVFPLGAGLFFDRARRKKDDPSDKD